MKRTVGMIVMAGLLLIAVSAVADELRPMTINTETGHMLYLSAFGPREVIAKDFGSKVAPFSYDGVEVSVALYYDEFLAPKTMGITGAAAGGERVDENTLIWEKALGPGGSDLP